MLQIENVGGAACACASVQFGTRAQATLGLKLGVGMFPVLYSQSLLGMIHPGGGGGYYLRIVSIRGNTPIVRSLLYLGSRRVAGFRV